MADLTDAATQKIFRDIIREEVRPIVQEAMRPIIREETADLRADVQNIKEVVGAQSMQLRAVTSDVTSLKQSFRQQMQAIHKLGVLFEDLDNRFAAASE